MGGSDLPHNIGGVPNTSAFACAPPLDLLLRGFRLRRGCFGPIITAIATTATRATTLGWIQSHQLVDGSTIIALDAIAIALDAIAIALDAIAIVLDAIADIDDARLWMDAYGGKCER